MDVISTHRPWEMWWLSLLSNFLKHRGLPSLLPIMVLEALVKDVLGKTCMQMAWPPSLNIWWNWKRSRSSGSLAWKENDFGSTWAKSSSSDLGDDSGTHLRYTVKTPVPCCVFRASSQTTYPVPYDPVWSTTDAVVSLALWKPITSFGVNDILDWPDQDCRPKTEVTEGREKLGVVPYFCYLGDCSSSGGGCELASITRCGVAWGEFNELLPIFTSCPSPITSRSKVYNSCVWSAMVHTKASWVPTSSDMHRLQPG